MPGRSRRQWQARRRQGRYAWRWWPSSEVELALIEERRLLKEEREKRHAQALEPRPSAVDRLVRTHHAQPSDKPKAAKEAHDVKKPKARISRAEKHAEKAAALEAARKSPKKPAK